MSLFVKKRVSPQWILYGEGARYCAPADCDQSAPQVLRIAEIRPPRECSSQELFTELVRRSLTRDG